MIFFVMFIGKYIVIYCIKLISEGKFEEGRNCRNSSSNSKEDMSADPERQSKYFYNRVWCGEFP